MKKIFVTFLLFSSLFSLAKAKPLTETWAYLMTGEERYFPARSSITDVACFSAEVGKDGELVGGHLTPPVVSAAVGTRYHLVITMPWNPTLAHIYLNPTLPFRARMIADIVARSQPFDGVQIDFEAVSKEDRSAYLSFLSAVKTALPRDKVFSVAVMARWADHQKRNPVDAFDYPAISQIADRVIVMAYDEHYRGGSAGPVASLPWCQKIFDYAVATVPAEKLVMGIPLYGRAWQKETTARAFRNAEVWTDLRVTGATAVSSAAAGGSYSYTTNVTIQVHFESMPSLDAKVDLYSSKPIAGLAFWRIGQEPIGYWDHLQQ
jgi:spore germination protein YaaH